MGEVRERFPLFPLGLVLLPGEVVPLHIFEERYKTMIGECLEEESEFGILWMGDEGLKEVGCSARVERVLERTEDGRMNIAVRGSQPFVLRRRIEEMEYPAGDVELLDDDVDALPGDLATAQESYATLVERVTDERPDDADLEELGAYDMAATIAFDLEEKQELLELRSEAERLGRLTALCATALKRYEHAERAAERAKTNGRVHT